MKEKYKETAKIWKANNRDKIDVVQRRYQYKKSYGITIEQYDEMLVKQKGVCEICKRPCYKKYLSVDHNHATNNVRGLLCDACNNMLGRSRDTPAILEAGAKYLRRYGGVDSRTTI